MNRSESLGGKSLRQSFSGLSHAPPWNLEKGATLFGLLTLVLVFSFLSPTFRQPSNLMLVVTQAAPIAIVAVGQTIVMLIGGIDLSVSSVVALTGLVAASLMKYGAGPIPPLAGPLSYVAIAVGLSMGLVIGGAQGWLIANRRMPPFIVTLGTMVGLKGLALSYSAGSSINSLPDDFKWISDGQVALIPAQVLIMLGIYAAAWYMLGHSKFGRYCYAIGGNETATRLSGVSVDRYKTWVYALSGFLAALAGMILIAYIDGGVFTNGDGYDLNSIAAAIIGGTSLSGGMGGVWGTLIGVWIIRVVPDGMVMLNAPSEWRDVVTGIVILLAVLIDVERRRTRKSARRVDVAYMAVPGKYLSEVLNRVTQAVEEDLGCQYCRIYLVDRETNDLLLQRSFGSADADGTLGGRPVPNRANIVHEARDKCTCVLVHEVAREGDGRVARMRPEIASALAMPVMVQNRVVGIVEVQSTIPDAFREEAVELLGNLCRQSAVMLEDAWLLESGWLMEQVRDALRHLWDDLYLGRTALAEWILAAPRSRAAHNPAARGEELRDMLLGAIASLQPPTCDGRDPSRSWRGHRILQLTYVEEHTADQISSEQHISRRQYFYDLKQALDTLTGALVRDHQAKRKAEPAKPGQRRFVDINQGT
jgi:ribose/xylose/arabinose/galactoside ABC-type transport system permease subunit/putative methionine-R-sulfoxide reductase with GAF domain